MYGQSYTTWTAGIDSSLVCGVCIIVRTRASNYVHFCFLSYLYRLYAAALSISIGWSPSNTRHCALHSVFIPNEHYTVYRLTTCSDVAWHQHVRNQGAETICACCAPFDNFYFIWNISCSWCVSTNIVASGVCPIYSSLIVHLTKKSPCVILAYLLHHVMFSSQDALATNTHTHTHAHVYR